MQIQVNTDNHIDGNEALTKHVEGALLGALDRFANQITRIEVQFNDVNGAKSGSQDIRCLLEARLGGLKPVAVSHNGENVAQALDGATEKLERMLEKTLDKLGDVKGRTSFAGEQGI